MPDGNILIVDDAPINLDVLALGLRARGYHVHPALNGTQALALARQQPPDVALLDILMPDMDGYQLCQQLKALYPDVPVIFVTALHDTLDKVRAFEVGGVDFLTKPLDIDEVFARVDAHLMLYRQRQHIARLLKAREAAELAEREQRLLVSALLDSAAAISGTLRLHEVLERILENVGLVVPHEAAIVVLTENGSAWVASVMTTFTCDWAAPGERIPIADNPLLAQMVANRAYRTVHDTHAETALTLPPGFEAMRAAVGAPILYDDEVLGVLALLTGKPGYYSDASARHLQAFAVHAGIALKNAQLYAKAQELAVMQERQRLARDLHDSVTQTLFSASAIVDALPRLMDKKPDKARSYLGELAGLMRGAMAEMRSLLVELRSETLVQTDLPTLLRQLCDAFTNRTSVPVTLDVHTLPVMSPAVKLTFYRVAQEALNNVARHAQARRVTLALTLEAGTAVLTLHDDGQGFDPDGVSEQHLGLRIMRERAAGIGARLTIASAPGSTTLQLRGRAT